MIGKLMCALEESPHKDNTIIILLGDHGWHLGEKEHWRKFTLWRTGTRTPLIKNPQIKWDYPVLISHGPGNFAVCADDWRYIRYYDGGKSFII